MGFLDINYIYNVLQEKDIVIPFEKSRVKNGAYELSLGEEVYLTDSDSKKVEILSVNNRGIDINPGQFALLQTKEKVKVPRDKIAFISIKAGEKLKGLVNVSGFHVDPGFYDHLVFSVYNAGPSIINLNYDEPYFPIWFSDFKSESKDVVAYSNKNEHFNKLSHIPTKYIESLKRGELTSPKALLDKITVVESSLNEKIIKSDEKKIRIDWLITLIIGLLITIALKSVYDWYTYDKGYNDAKNYKTVIQQIQSKIEKPYIDSVINHRVDSIIKKNIKKNETGKH